VTLPGATGETLMTDGWSGEADEHAVTRADGTTFYVYDDVIADLAAYTAAVRALPFASVEIDRQQTFHGIATSSFAGALSDWIVRRFPQLRPRLTFFRQSPAGQVEPTFIHADSGMGEWTGILYLTEMPPPGDGTLFWRDRLTGAVASTAQTDAEQAAEWAAWRQPDQWEVWAHVHARPNRLLLFPSALYHSRALEANYGAGATARLIQVIFGTGSLRRR